MSLLSKPLDYSSQTTKATINGIRNQVETASRVAQEKKAEQKRIDGITSRIEGQFASMQGDLGSLDEGSKKIFEGYVQGYTQDLNTYANNPSQENLNMLMTTVSKAQNFLKIAPASYSSDRSTLLRGVMEPDKYEESGDQMRSTFNAKHGAEGLDVRWNEETHDVEVIDPNNGAGDYTNPLATNRYSTDPEKAMVFTPKNNFNYTTPFQYGATKARTLIPAGNTESYGKFFESEFATDPQLQQSVVLTYAEAQGTTPQAINANPDLLADAKEYYLEQGRIEMQGLIDEEASKLAAQESPFAGVTKKNLVGKNIELDVLKKPITMTVPLDPTKSTSEQKQYSVKAYRVVDDTLVVNYQEKSLKFETPGGTALLGQDLRNAQNDYFNEKVGIGSQYVVREVFEDKSTIIADPLLMDGFAQELRRLNLPFNK